MTTTQTPLPAGTVVTGRCPTIGWTVTGPVTEARQETDLFGRARAGQYRYVIDASADPRYSGRRDPSVIVEDATAVTA